MGWYFDGTDHVTLGNDSAQDIPNGDWTICGWFRVAGNSGTNYPKLLCWGTPGGTPHVQIFLAQSSTGVGNADTLSACFIGPGAVDTGILYNASFAVSSHTDKWIPWCLTHDEATDTTYLRVYDTATGTTYNDSSVVALPAITNTDITGAMYIGSSVSGGNDRIAGDLADFAFLPGVYFDDGHWQAYIRGGRANRFPSCQWYLPMLGGRYEDWKNQLTVTNTGSAASTGHPPLQLITPKHHNISATWSTPGGLRVTRQSVDVIGQKGSDLRVATQSVDVVGLTDPDIRIYRVALEYLRELVVYVEGASSTIALTQSATTNFKTQDITSTIVLTQAASYDCVRNRQAESELELLGVVDYIGPKWVSANSAIALTQDTYIPEVYEVEAGTTIVFSQDTSHVGTQRLEADSTLVLTQFADTPLKIRSTSSQINLTQSASAGMILTASSHIALTQSATLTAINPTATSQLNLAHEARYQPLPQFAESQIILTQSTWQNIRYLQVNSQINLTQLNSVSKPIQVSATTELSTTEWLIDPETGETTEQDTGLRQSVETIHDGTRSAESMISFNCVVGLTHVLASGTAVSASSTLALTQEAILSTVATGTSAISLSQAAVAQAGKSGYTTIELTQEASVNFSKAFTIQSEIEVRHAAAFTLIVASTPYQYSPFVGGTSDPDAPMPPPTTLQGPMAGIQVPFQLVYPSIGAVTDSLSLKTPNFGNLDRLAFNRVQRETRGGSLVIYADPIWPKIQTLILTFSGLKRVEAQNLLTFIDDHIGQEIGLIDWEHRYWKGVITAPDQPIVEDSFDSFTSSFEFQGELDPTWNPQVVPPSLRYSAIRSEQEEGYYVPNEPQLPTIPEADYLSAEADSTVKIGYAVYLKSSGHLDPAKADAQSTSGIIGVSISDAMAGALCKYLSEGKVTRSDWTEVAGAALLTPGVTYYLSPTTAGQITSTAPTTTGQSVAAIGRATSTTELDIEIGTPVLL